jgi:hypothetical protein
VVSRMEVAPAERVVVAVVPPAQPVPSTPVTTLPAPVVRAPVVTAPRVEASADNKIDAADNDAALAAERTLLARAKASLAAGDPGGALIALADAQGRGQLREEREALVIFALVDAGRSAEAKAKFKSFGQRYPRSLFQSRLEQRLQQAVDPID